MGEPDVPVTIDAGRETLKGSSELRNQSSSPTPFVVAVILNWNQCDDTLACLESLDRIDYSRLGVVVVENGSTDDSESRLRETRPDLSIIRTEVNLGFAGGCNLGIEHAIA